MLYLSDLRAVVRNSGDYVNDAHIKDTDINIWLNQAFSKVWIGVCAQDNNAQVKKITIDTLFDNVTKKSFINFPQDYFSIQDIYILDNDRLYTISLATTLNEYQSTNTDNSKYNDKQVCLFYNPQPPILLEKAPTDPAEGTGYDFILPLYWQYFLVDYAIKRSRMKQDDEVSEIDMEEMRSYKEIMVASQHKNNHSPEVARSSYTNSHANVYDPFDNDNYLYYPMGSKIFLL